MLYAFVAHDIENSTELRQQFSQAHRERLNRLLEQGRLVVAGPCPIEDLDMSAASGFSGSIIIAEFDSLKSAKQWADADPFVVNGVYLQVSVRPFKQFLP